MWALQGNAVYNAVVGAMFGNHDYTKHDMPDRNSCKPGNFLDCLIS